MGKKNMFGEYVKDKSKLNKGKIDQEESPGSVQTKSQTNESVQTSKTENDDQSSATNKPTLKATLEKVTDEKEKTEPKPGRAQEPQREITIEDHVPEKLPFPKSVLPWNIKQTELTKELMKAGYTSIKLIATATEGEIASLTSLNSNQIKKLIQNAKGWEEFKFETAANLLEDRRKLQRISTGSNSLDMLLGGGIEPRSITEFYGSYTTGKTQLSIQLAVNTALPLERGGLDGHVIYIDTEGSFRPERVVQICQGLDINHNKILNKIMVGRAHNTTIQMQLTNTILELANKYPVRLIVIDSLTSNFRAEYIGKGSIMDRQQKMNQHVQQLSRISDMLNVAVVITNQVMSVIDGFENSVQPVGGNILAHGSTHRIELSKSNTHNSVRYAKLIASPSLPESTANYKITPSGIKDVLDNAK